MKYIISFDVGGTTVEAGIYEQGAQTPVAVKTYPSCADRDEETVFGNFEKIISELWGYARGEDALLWGLGLGFPGPCDYPKGICLIEGLNKFESIYGICVNERLAGICKDKLKLPLSPDFAVKMENDAAVFAMGFYKKNKAALPERVVCVTLGTGFGSSFLDGGAPVRGAMGIPEDGMIYHVPFKGKIIDDLVSKRGILALAEKYEDAAALSVADIAKKADEGNEQCKAVFREFGSLMGEALLPFFESFSPKALVLGGNISRAHGLFLDSVYEALRRDDIKTFFTEDEGHALFGASALISGI